MGIFARVLQEILAAHVDDDYSRLGGQSPRTDPVWYPLRRLAIPPEVISRLKEAAASDDRRATLNPDDLAYVTQQLKFSNDEQTALRAALLAQGVEMFLRDRLRAAEEAAATAIAETVFERLLEQFDSTFDKVRAEPSVLTGENDERIELALMISERAASMVLAAAASHSRGSPADEAFWRRMASTAYLEAATVSQPANPALAVVLQAYAQRLAP